MIVPVHMFICKPQRDATHMSLHKNTYSFHRFILFHYFNTELP
jgi:hypothetical protein